MNGRFQSVFCLRIVYARSIVTIFLAKTHKRHNNYNFLPHSRKRWLRIPNLIGGITRIKTSLNQQPDRTYVKIIPVLQITFYDFFIFNFPKQHIFDLRCETSVNEFVRLNPPAPELLSGVYWPAAFGTDERKPRPKHK